MGAKNVEDVYPLSPMQEGLLFHSLYAEDHAVYVTHITCTLENLDVPAFERAWQQVMNRHPALRMRFAEVAGRLVEQNRHRQRRNVHPDRYSGWVEPQPRPFVVRGGTHLRIIVRRRRFVTRRLPTDRC